MDRMRRQIDAKSILIGFLLAVVAALLLNGLTGRAAETCGAVAADDRGVYIMIDGSVRYIEKQKCLQGCHINSE